MDEADAAPTVVGMAEGVIPPMTGGAKYGTPLPPPRLRLQSRRPARGTAASVGSFVLGSENPTGSPQMLSSMAGFAIPGLRKKLPALAELASTPVFSY
jgi:hypothetical protein